jgi:exosortase/archaeosortase family protein
VIVLELRRTTHQGPWHPTVARGSVAGRLAALVVVVPFAFVALRSWWISAETAVVGGLLSMLGVDVQRTGAELLLHDHGDPIVLVVIGWCSSLGPLLALVGLAWALPGQVRRRPGALCAAVALVVLGNLVRLTAVGWVAARWAPTAVDGFHDGPATAFAVVVVLLAVAIVVLGAPWRVGAAAR